MSHYSSICADSIISGPHRRYVAAGGSLTNNVWDGSITLFRAPDYAVRDNHNSTRADFDGELIHVTTSKITNKGYFTCIIQDHHGGFLIGSTDGTLNLIDREAFEKYILGCRHVGHAFTSLYKHPSAIEKMDYVSENGSPNVILADSLGKLLVLKVEYGKILHTFNRHIHSGRVTALKTSSKRGMIVSASLDESVNILDLRLRELAFKFNIPDSSNCDNTITALDFGSDFITMGTLDHRLLNFDLRNTERALWDLKNAADGAIRSVCWEKYRFDAFASASDDGKVKIFDSYGKLLSQYSHIDKVMDLKWYNRNEDALISAGWHQVKFKKFESVFC